MSTTPRPLMPEQTSDPIASFIEGEARQAAKISGPDEADRLHSLEMKIESLENTVAAQVELLNQIKDALGPFMEKLENSPVIRMLGIR